MNIEALQNPGIPVVGVPMVAGGAQIVASVTCKCDSLNAPMVVCADQGVICNRCKNIYAIGRAAFQAGQQGVMVQIQLVGKADVRNQPIPPAAADPAGPAN